VRRVATKKESAGCFFLCLPFAAGGIFMSYLYIADLIQWTRMRTWEEVPARILSTDLEITESRTSTTNFRRTGSSQRSILYKALADYEYVYQDKKYRGTTVSRYFGSDNIGNFYTDIVSELSKYENSEKFFRCYVNPDSPDEAILYRHMRLSMLCLYGGLGGIFGGLSFGMIAGLLAAYLSNKRVAILKQQNPEEPWKWRQDWVRGEVRADSSSKMFVVLAITVWVGLFSIPILAFIPAKLMEGNYAAILALIYPIVGYLIIKSTIGSILQWIRFGRAVLQLSSIPIQPGERLRGIIRTGRKLPDSADVRLELRNVKRRSGDEPEWTQNTTPIVGADGKSSIQVDVEIPDQIIQTGKRSKKSRFEWELRAFSKIPGIDLDAAFKIPVFSKKQS
jgi:hypothetical protein